MSHTLTQPEEVDLALMELETVDCMPERSAADNHASYQTIPAYGYVSPYRAAHLKAMQNPAYPLR